MIQRISAYLRDDGGATAIEYGLIAALVSVAGIAALTLMGTSLTNIFLTVGTLIDDATTGATAS